MHTTAYKVNLRALTRFKPGVGNKNRCFYWFLETKRIETRFINLENRFLCRPLFQAFCYKWLVPLTVFLQIGILLVNTTNQSLEKVVGAKAISKYADKQEKAKMITFVTQMVTGIMTIANVAIEAFCPYLWINRIKSIESTKRIRK